MAIDHLSQGTHINLEAIQSLVQKGKTVISAEDSTIIELAMKAIEEGKTATFYLKPTLFTEIRKRYWALGRGNPADLEPISPEQAARIKSDFNIEVDGYANKVNCPRCGNVYSTYEFIQQGFEEHGEEIVRAVFSVKDLAILQIHPTQNAICRGCGLHLALTYYLHKLASGRSSSGGYGYDYWCRAGNGYACCL
jgi:hypothetical protein